jgi:protein-S-isoprenylcysteine O-methyltransferase Ste14
MVIWIVNGRWLVESIKKHVTSEIYTHIGLGVFLTLLALELTMGIQGSWSHFNVRWLGIIGWILYVPAAFFVFGAIATLQYKGNPVEEMTETTMIITTGIYSIIRQPMTLGMFIWSIALILVFQSVVSIILCVPSALCFWIAARKDIGVKLHNFAFSYSAFIL